MHFTIQELRDIVDVLRLKRDVLSEWSLERQLCCCAALEKLRDARNAGDNRGLASAKLLLIKTSFKKNVLTPNHIRLVYRSSNQYSELRKFVVAAADWILRKTGDNKQEYCSEVAIERFQIDLALYGDETRSATAHRCRDLAWKEDVRTG